MPLKVRPYLSSDFNAWLDLTATSSIELDEEYLIWNARPILPPDSFSYLLLNKNSELIATADLVWLKKNEILNVKHWASRKASIDHDLLFFLDEIKSLTKASVRLWISNPEIINRLLLKPKVKLIEKKIAFFVEGGVLPNGNQEIGFCDHIFGTCAPEYFDEITNSLPLANKEFLLPKYQSCLEFSLN